MIYDLPRWTRPTWFIISVSIFEQSNNQTIQQFNNSTIQQFNNSTIQQFFEATKVGENCRFLIADFGLKCKYFYVPNFSFNGITCCVALLYYRL